MRRLVTAAFALTLVPAALVALPVLSPSAPSPHPVSPKVFHIRVAAGSGAALPSVLANGAAVTTLQENSSSFRAAGVSWKHDPQITSVKAEIRVRTAGRWTAWQEIGLSDSGPDGDVEQPAAARNADRRDSTEPLWVDHADGVQARISDVVGPTPQDLRIDLVDPGTSAADATAGKTRVVSSTAVAEAAQPAIISRAGWGADESIRLNSCPGGPQYTGDPKVAFVHHTVTGNGYAASDVPAIIRSIYAYHVLGEGWCDIGYNFLVDAYGRTWEGRYGGVDRPVLGAHTGGFNTDSFGVSLIGTFTSVTPPPAMVSAVSSLIAWKLGMSYANPLGQTTLTAASFSGSRFPVGASVPLNVISGHRDADSTSCPGDGAYALLPQIRQQVLQDMGAGLVSPSATVTSPRLLSSNGSVHLTSGLISPGAWQLAVQNASSNTVRTVSGNGSTIDTAWPMTDDAGAPVPAGAYTLTLTSVQNGQSARPWTVQVFVGGVFGATEQARVSPGHVEILGWAVQAADTAPARLVVTINGATVGTGSTGGSRPDVGAVYPAYGNNRGYDITESMSPGYHTVCIYGDNSTIGLPNNRVGCLGVTGAEIINGGTPIGSLDRAVAGPGTIVIGGWALDGDTSASITVHAYVDGTFWGAFTALDSRPDIAAAFPGEGPSHGYNAILTGLGAGTHQLCMWAIDDGGGGPNPRIGCASVSSPWGDPKGAMDLAQGLPGSIRVAGWALDPDTSSPIAVHIYVDGQWGGYSVASGDRPDIAAAYPGYGSAHGYDTTVAASGGTHQVCTYAINVALGTLNTPLRCATVTVPSGNPHGALDMLVGQTGGARVAGWALDPDTVGPVQVHVYSDGGWNTALSADTSRPDVAAAFPGFGAGHGYDSVISLTPGQHNVCVYAINVGPGTGNPLIGCRSITAS